MCRWSSLAGLNAGCFSAYRILHPYLVSLLDILPFYGLILLEPFSMAASEIPKKQKAAVYDQPGSVSTKIVELDVPEPSAGEVLINL